MGIAENIKRERINAGMTQEQLAERLDVARSTITQWETGWTQPRMGAVARLAEVFGMSVSEMVADDPTRRDGDITLSSEERELISLFRSMDKRARNDLLAIASSLSPSSAGQDSDVRQKKSA